MSNVALGIDLGTTNSCVCVFVKGELMTIENEIGTTLTPSYVAIEKGDNFIVGLPAKDQIAVSQQGTTIYDVKRMIGRRFNDPALQERLTAWPFKLKELNNAPMIAVDGKSYFPEQISAHILRSLRRNAEDTLGIQSISKAVITVPAYFNDGQRQATKDAGILAGLEVLRVINEPTAAAISYVFHQPRKDEAQNLLMFDLGGGTFDVSIVTVTKNGITVNAVGGDTNLGGGDFDTALVEYCMDEFRKGHGEKFKNVESRTDRETLDKLARFKQRLRITCEKHKEFLAKTKQTKVIVDGAFAGLDLSVAVSRSRFNEMNEMYFRKCIAIMAQVMEDAGLEPSGIDDIVLVGGSTRIPRIREMIAEYFGGRQPSSILNGAEAVAQGAALLAALLVNGNRIQTRDKGLFQIKFTDVVPLSLGTDIVPDGGIHKIVMEMISKNTPIPCSKFKKLGVFHDGQDTAMFSVFEGDERDPEKGYKLGTFTFDVPEMYRKIDVFFEKHLNVSPEGIIDVAISFTRLGTSKKFHVVPDKGRLSKEQLVELRLQ